VAASITHLAVRFTGSDDGPWGEIVTAGARGDSRKKSGLFGRKAKS